VTDEWYQKSTSKYHCEAQCWDRCYDLRAGDGCCEFCIEKHGGNCDSCDEACEPWRVLREGEDGGCGGIRLDGVKCADDKKPVTRECPVDKQKVCSSHSCFECTYQCWVHENCEFKELCVGADENDCRDMEPCCDWAPAPPSKQEIPDDSCFLPGTEISTSYGFNSIEDIEVGNYVLSYNEETGENEISSVSETFVHEADEYLIINGILKVTHNHPMWINNEWKEISGAKKGDVLKDVEGEDIIVKTIETVQEPVTVYNLEVSGTHTYYAESLLAHNKAECEDDSECVNGFCNDFGFCEGYDDESGDECTDTCWSKGYDCGQWEICGNTEYCGPCGANQECDNWGKCVSGTVTTCRCEEAIDKLCGTCGCDYDQVCHRTICDPPGCSSEHGDSTCVHDPFCTSGQDGCLDDSNCPYGQICDYGTGECYVDDSGGTDDCSDWGWFEVFCCFFFGCDPKAA